MPRRSGGKRYRAYLGALLALCVAGMVGSSFAKAAPVSRPAQPVGLVVSARGDAEISLIEARAWRIVEVRQDLLTGDDLRTGPLGALALLFSDHTQIRVQRNSELKVKAVAMSAAQNTLLDLARGAIWSRAQTGGSGVRVETPAATAAIRGTDWALSVDGQGRTTLIVLSGEVQLANAAGTLTVQAGEIATALIGQPPTKTFLVNPSERPQLILYADLSSTFRYLPPAPGSTPERRAARQRLEAIPPSERSADDWLDLAEILIADEAWPAARAAREKAAKALGPAAPTSPRLAYVDGYLAAYARDHAAAAARFGKVVGLDAFRTTRALAERYLAQLLARDADGARASEVEIRALTTRSADALLVLLVTAGFLGDLETAEALAQDGVRRFPDVAAFRLLQAQINLLLGRTEAVGSTADAAVRALPNEPQSWLARGIYDADVRGDSEAAIASFHKALALTPNDVDVLNELALSLYAIDERRGAEAALRHGLAIDPLDAVLLANLAIILLDESRLGEAAAAIAELRARDPSLASGLTAAGRLAFHRGDVDAALQLFLEAVAANPALADATLGTAIAYAAKEDFASARQAIDDALRLDPNDPNPAIAGSVIARDLARADQSILLAREANARIERSGGSGQSFLSASRGGATNLGSAFTFLDLDGWGRFYADRLFSDFDSGSLFFRGTTATDDRVRRSSVTQGLILDPLGASSRLRYTDLLRRPFTDVEIGGSLGNTSGAWSRSGSFDVEAYHDLGRPVSIAAVGTAADADGDRPHSDTQSYELTTLAGTELTPFDTLSLVGSASHANGNLPGFDTQTAVDSRVRGNDYSLGLGYGHSFGARNELMSRVFVERQEADLRSTDPATTIDSKADTLNGGLQLRHAVTLGKLEVSTGVEALGSRTQSNGDVRTIIFGDASARDDTRTWTLGSHLDLLYAATPGFQVEAGLFPEQRFEDGNAKGPRAGPRLGLAWQPIRDQWLRLSWQDDRLTDADVTLAPVTVVGLYPDLGSFNATGTVKALIARWDAEWMPHLFTSLELQHQDLSDITIELPGTLARFQADAADVDSVTLATNVWLVGGLGLFATGTLRHSDNRSDGPGHGEQVPLVPGRELRAGITWVHPTQVRVTLSTTMLDDRTSELSGDAHLDTYASTDLQVSWQPLEKHLDLGLSLLNIFDDDNELGPNLPAPGRTVLATARVRF